MSELVRSTEILDGLAANGTLRKTGLYLSEPDISYERLEAFGAYLASVRKTVQFAIGDLLLQVEHRFPERFSQFAEILEMSEGGLQDYLRVAEKVPRSIRREKLSWSHHRAVAALTIVDNNGESISDVNSQKQWLERAETERLSHHQLRAALRVDEPPDPGVCRCCKRPL